MKNKTVEASKSPIYMLFTLGKVSVQRSLVPFSLCLNFPLVTKTSIVFL